MARAPSPGHGRPVRLCHPAARHPGDDPLTPEVLDDLESLLFTGVQATDQVLAALRQRLNEESSSPRRAFVSLKTS